MKNTARCFLWSGLQCFCVMQGKDRLTLGGHKPADIYKPRYSMRLYRPVVFAVVLRHNMMHGILQGNENRAGIHADVK